ncbi:MAG: carbon-nitrogen hydrolase family protein [Fuerstiella sp.]|nr:carbon-nitrogen hydrolase family protein [Fuerstiella sp.]
MQKTRAAVVSMASRFGRPAENLERIISWSKQAAEQEADIVCFPEICLQGYHTDVSLMHQQAELLEGPCCERLVEAAGRSDLVISVGMAIRQEEKVFNAQVFFGSDGPLGFAAKVHLCGEEAKMFHAGTGWSVIDLGFARVGTAICYDAEFPEAVRCLALKGAEIVLISFATGRCDSCGRSQDPLVWPAQVARWAPARAYENRIFVMGVNHAGNVADDDCIAGASWIEPGAVHRWPGYSFAIDPGGEWIGESACDHNDERLLVVDFDPQALAEWREGSGDFINARRPETYGLIAGRSN